MLSVTIGAFFLFWGLLWGLLRKFLPSERGKATRAAIILFDLVVWSIVVIQQLAQVLKASAPGLPPAVRQIADGLQLVRLDTNGILPPECYTASPFESHLTNLGLSIGCGLLAVFMLAMEPCVLFRSKAKNGEAPDPADSKSKPKAGAKIFGLVFRLALMLSAMLYSLGVSTAVEIVHCVSVELQATEGPSPGDPSTSTSTSTGSLKELESSLVWAKQPELPCYNGQHFPAAILAWSHSQYWAWSFLYSSCMAPHALFVIMRVPVKASTCRRGLQNPSQVSRRAVLCVQRFDVLQCPCIAASALLKGGLPILLRVEHGSVPPRFSCSWIWLHSRRPYAEGLSYFTLRICLCRSWLRAFGLCSISSSRNGGMASLVGILSLTRLCCDSGPAGLTFPRRLQRDIGV